MEKYTKYEDSGIEWIGEIPKDWEIKSLKYFATVNNDVLTELTDPDFEFRYVDIGSVSVDEGISQYQSFAFKESPSRARRIVKSGDVIVSTVRTYLKAVACISDDENVIVSTGFAVVRPQKVQAEFLKYTLLNHYFVETVSSLSVGISYPAINASILMSIKNVLPPMNEQKKIAAYLDRKTAQIDSIIANKENLIELLKEKRQAIISEAVTHGLDTSVPMEDSGIDWIGQIPAHWEIKPLFIVASENRAKNDGNQCDNLLSLSYGKIINKDIETNFGLLPESFETYQIVQGGYTILRLTDLQNDKRSLRTGFVKETGIITSAYVGLIPTVALDGCFLSDLLYAYDIMKIFYSLGNGVRQSMNYKDLKRLPILIPPIAEQQKISATLLQETAKLDALVSEIESQIVALKEYRQSIISEAVTGKIKVVDSEMVATVEQPKAKTNGANIHFKRRVLAAKILDKLCGENTLGHVKLEKLLFLSEYCAELDMHTEYVRHAAGPYSPKVLRSIDTQLQTAKWFAYDKNNRGSKYCRLDKSTEYAPYFNANFSAEQNTTVERLVELFRTVDTERCEIVATLYGAWNDFLIDGCTPTDEQIADEVLTHWSEEKKRIERDRWLKAIGWMRKHQIVPHGYGEKTKRRDI